MDRRRADDGGRDARPSHRARLPRVGRALRRAALNDARRRRALRIAAALVLQVVLAIALFDAALFFYFRHPVRLAGVQTVARQIYASADRAIIQFDPASARYDEELFYTLRPGRFVFAQHEFRTPYEVNALGVRDTAAALAAPEIVVVGDSVAMGWGVGQDQTFAKLIEQRTGRRVLNAAVSSYGTVRELLLLNRIDRSRLRWLIVQYNANDVGENRVFLASGNRHPGGNREKYERTVTRSQARRGYVPGRYAWTAVNILARNVREVVAPRPVRGPAPTVDEEADWFVNALLHAGPADVRRARIVVFEATADGATSAMIPTLQRRRAAGTLPPGMQDVILLDVASRLGPDDYFIVDDHPNARAHRKIADALLATLGPSP